MSNDFEEFRETRNEYISQNPPAEHGLAKNVLFIKMVEGTTRNDRLIVANTISAALDDNFIVFDCVNYAED